eukprot:SAG31_NODE_179_length_21090_cov_11.862871_3_plen_86_part_00
MTDCDDGTKNRRRIRLLVIVIACLQPMQSLKLVDAAQRRLSNFLIVNLLLPENFHWQLGRQRLEQICSLWRCQIGQIIYTAWSKS